MELLALAVTMGLLGMVTSLSMHVAIRIIDPGNPLNNLVTACFFAVLLAPIATFGSVSVLMSVVALMMLLVNYYGLGLFRSVGTLALTGLFSQGALYGLRTFVMGA